MSWGRRTSVGSTVSLLRCKPGLAGVLLACMMGAGCASLDRLPAPEPMSGESSSAYRGIADARLALDADPALVRRMWLGAETRRAAATGGRPGPSHMLALSGGGADGAFGAGLLAGWTASGKRPHFEFVTGVSTGALIAPFAFLGPAYDAQLRTLYTSLSDAEVAVQRPLLALLSADSLAETAPLARLIEANFTADMMQAIGQEHGKGRVLLVATTDLDLGRPMIWNIGAIAASGHRDALALIRRILLASASIPGLFPPVLFDSDMPGRQELHVDGGVTNQLFLYATTVPLSSAPPHVRSRTRVAWIIRNGRFAEARAETARGLLPIARRSISTLIAANAAGDTYRAFVLLRRDGIAYNLAAIPDSFAVQARTPFDRDYMAALFDLGFNEGRSGRIWRTTPPGLARD